jgi:hypothetical protein
MGASGGAFRRSKLQYTGRAFRQDADQAMRSDIFRGLVEAITNADDAYGDRPGEITIRIDRVHGRIWNVSVLDNATGIRLQEMEDRLATIGARTSGYERGERVRGNRGRGAKDLAAYGAVRWDSIVDGQYAVLEIERGGRYRVAREPQDATPELRTQLGIRTNGTRVSISCRGNVTRPRFETMVNKLERLVPLRDIMQNPRRKITLAYLEEPPITLRYVLDDTLRHVEQASVEVLGYPELAELDLYEAREALPGGPGDLTRENGVLVKSGRAVHEATLFDFEMDPYGALFAGSVRWDTIDDLMREFDERDERGHEPNRSNPFPIISRTRDGLEKTHPAYEALRKAVDPVLAQHIARRRAEDANLAAETTQTRRRLSQLARIVTRFSLAKEEELELELSSGFGGEAHMAALRIIPRVKRLEFGEEATFTVIARRDAVREMPAEVGLAVSSEILGIIEVSQHRLRLDEIEESALLRGSFTVIAGSAKGNAVVAVTMAGSEPCRAAIEVAEPMREEARDGGDTAQTPASFSFEREHYSVPLAKRRLLRLLAPADLVAMHGAAVSVRSGDSAALEVRDSRISLRRSVQGNWYQARICVEGKHDAAAVRVTARLGNSLEEATATLAVGREPSGQQMTIEIGQFSGAARARWQRDPDGNVTITINAVHPAAQRYMGDPPEFPGQESSLSRLLIAEIVAEEVVRDLLSRRHRGNRVDADAYAADRQRLLADLLPRCHAAQLSATEVDGFVHRNGKTRAPLEGAATRRAKRQPELF